MDTPAKKIGRPLGQRPRWRRITLNRGDEQNLIKVLGAVFFRGDNEFSQEWWIDNFVNAEESYSQVKDLYDRLRANAERNKVRGAPETFTARRRRK